MVMISEIPFLQRKACAIARGEENTYHDGQNDSMLDGDLQES